jgi:hypothetical protein
MMAALLVALYLGGYAVLSLIWIVVGRISSPPAGKLHSYNPEMLIILPAYRPGPIFRQVLESVTKGIGKRNIHVLVLLQHADEAFATLAHTNGFFVEQQAFDHLPGNSYQHALRYLCGRISALQNKGEINPEFVMLLDKDNLISPDFFDRIPSHVYDRYDIIQGQRLSIDTKTAISFFDHLTERLNDTMFRQAKQNLGLMVELSGSGALIETDLFLETIGKLDPNAPGFDKNFMVQLLQSARTVRTIFWPHSTLREEKTSSQAAHNPQRVRWFGEQYYNACYSAGLLLKAAWRYKRVAPIDYLITLCRPPRSVQLVLIAVLAVAEWITFWWRGEWPMQYPLFSAAAIVQALAIVIFLHRHRALSRSLRYAVYLPTLALHNVINAMKSLRKENRGTFIHTPHQL